MIDLAKYFRRFGTTPPGLGDYMRGKLPEPRNPLAGLWLEETPEALYQANITGFTDPMRRFYSGRFPSMYREYLGALAKEAGAGQMPKLTFGSFLGDYPFMQRFMGETALDRVRTASRLAPRARFLNY